MANIAEGFGRHSDKEFANFLNIARGSAFEVQSHLYVALDLSYVTELLFQELYGLLDEILLCLDKTVCWQQPVFGSRTRYKPKPYQCPKNPEIFHTTIFLLFAFFLLT